MPLSHQETNKRYLEKSSMEDILLSSLRLCSPGRPPIRSDGSELTDLINKKCTRIKKAKIFYNLKCCFFKTTSDMNLKKVIDDAFLLTLVFVNVASGC